MTSIGYKKLRNGWIAKLQILGETNENRQNIVDKNYAKYRTSEAKVLKIFKKSGESTEETHESISGLYNKNFTYKTGEIVKPNSFDPDLGEVCSSGIHYFKTYEQAYMWTLEYANYTGEYKEWHNNGQLFIECEFINGVRHGSYREWYDNGQLWIESEYVNGTLH